jgi:acyl carrier protein
MRHAAPLEGNLKYSAREIQDWLVARVSQAAGVPQQQIAVQEPVLAYGLDSMAVLALTADLGQWLGYRFQENPLDDYPTIEALAAFLAQQTAMNDQESSGSR